MLQQGTASSAIGHEPAIERYRSRTPRVWFPAAREKLEPRCRIGYANYADRSPDRLSIQPPYSRKVVGAVYREATNSPEPEMIGLIKMVPGYLIPLSELQRPEDYPGEIGMAEVFAAALRVAMQVEHSEYRMPILLQSPLEALARKTGNCVDRASLIASNCRAMNVPARIVGQENFFGPDRPHWWVEAYLDAKWSAVDSTYHLEEFLPKVLEEITRAGFSDRERAAYLLAQFRRAIAEGRRVDLISDPAHADAVAHPVVAPEIGLPAQSGGEIAVQEWI